MLFFRTFNRIALALVGVLFVSQNSALQANQQIIQEVLDGNTIPKFVDPLPTFNGRRVDGTKPLKVIAEEFQQKILPSSFYAALPDSVTYRSVESNQPVVVINPRKGTYLWGYKIYDGEKFYGPSYPAHTIVAKRGVKTKVKYVNCLCPFKDNHGHFLCGPLLQKFLTVDLSFQWANPLKYPQYGQGFDTYDPQVYPFGTGLPQGNAGFYEGPQPMTVHLHGAESPSFSDGDPDSWFTPGMIHRGPSFVSNKYVYPNGQQATTLWFHDHVLGETRLNIYAGLLGFYFIRGAPESLVTPKLPRGKYEIELAIADRQFDTNGQLFFPDGNPLTAGLNGPPGNPDINPYAIPEFFGDVICVNGKSWPYLEVEPRRYRFRVLNASNARMYGLYLAKGTPLIRVTNPTIWQIGSDGGLFDKPVDINSFIPFTYNPSNLCPPADPNLGPVFKSPRLFISPAERMDIIIDFSGHEGEVFTLKNNAPAPFPSGGTELLPDVEGVVMQFRVTKPLSSPDTSFNPALPGATLRSGDDAVVKLTNDNGGLAPGVTPNLTRSLVLIEQEDPYSTAPVVVLCNNTTYDGINPYTNEPLPDSVPYNNGSIYVTEIPQVGSTEIWEIVNLTPDAHPIHIHLIQFQVLNRQVFNIGNIVPPFTCNPSYRLNAYEAAWPPTDLPVPPGTIYSYGPPFRYLSTPKLGGNPDVDPYLVGNPFPADPNELYWKDTIKMFPGTVTRLVVRWAPQSIPISGVSAGQNKFPFDPTATIGVKNDGFGYPGGSGYVWHCHIVDHEDNMMMRPIKLSNSAQR